MKKLLTPILIILTVAALMACAPTGIEVEETTVGETVGNAEFTLSIWADNSVYKADEPIECYGMPTYMGQEDITVLHAHPLVVFCIEGGKFSGDWAQQDSLERTTFAPEQDIVFPFQKSGGWSANDPDASFFEAFYADDELRLPAGEYTLSAVMEYSTDENDIRGTRQTLTVSINITVEE